MSKAGVIGLFLYYIFLDTIGGIKILAAS